MKYKRNDIISFCSYTSRGMHEYRDGLLPKLSVLYDAKIFIVHELRDIKLMLRMLHARGGIDRIIVWLGKHLRHLTELIIRLSGCEVAFIGENYNKDHVPVFHKPRRFRICQEHAMLYLMSCTGMSLKQIASSMQVDVKKLYNMENYLKRCVGAPNRIILYAFSGIIPDF